MAAASQISSDLLARFGPDPVVLERGIEDGSFFVIVGAKEFCNRVACVRELVENTELFRVSGACFSTAIPFNLPKLRMTSDQNIQFVGIKFREACTACDGVPKYIDALPTSSHQRAARDPSQTFNYVDPRRNTMVSMYHCQYCLTDSRNPVSEVTTSYLVGWLLCETCMAAGIGSKLMKEYMLRSNRFSISFLSNSEFDGRFSKDGKIVLKFWRKSQNGVQMTSSFMNDYDGTFLTLEGDPNPHFGFTFKDQTIAPDPSTGRVIQVEPEIIADHVATTSDKKQSRGIRLANLFYYNPGLYEALISSQSLFPSASQFTGITYSDLSDDVKAKIEAEKDFADTSDGKFNS